MVQKMQIVTRILSSYMAHFLVQRMFRQEQCHIPRHFCTMLSIHLQLILPLPWSHTERMKRLSHSGDDAELMMCLVVKVKPNAV